MRENPTRSFMKTIRDLEKSCLARERETKKRARLLYAGEEDTYPHSTAKACAEIMQNALFVSLPGLDHMGAFRSRDQVLPHVLKFLESLD